MDVKNECKLCGKPFEANKVKEFCSLECKAKFKMMNTLGRKLSKGKNVDVDPAKMEFSIACSNLVLEYDIKTAHDVKLLDKLIYDLFVIEPGNMVEHHLLGKVFSIKRVR